MLNRLVIHWTAGVYYPNLTDLQHYHYLVDVKGNVHNGVYKPEDNINCKDGKYAQSTGGFNTGTLAISLCAMAGFVDRNHIGNYPLTEKQVEVACKLAAEKCKKYGILISNIHTHYEISKMVQSGKIPKNNLTIQNIGKVDITVLPYDLSIKPDEVGNYLRNKVLVYYNRIK